MAEPESLFKGTRIKSYVAKKINLWIMVLRMPFNPGFSKLLKVILYSLHSKIVDVLSPRAVSTLRITVK